MVSLKAAVQVMYFALLRKASCAHSKARSCGFNVESVRAAAKCVRPGDAGSPDALKLHLNVESDCGPKLDFAHSCGVAGEAGHTSVDGRGIRIVSMWAREVDKVSSAQSWRRTLATALLKVSLPF